VRAELQALARAHSIPVGASVRWRLGDVRVDPATVGRGRVVEHAWRHGVVPMYWVELKRPITLVTGKRTRRLLFWEEQISLS
jgi:hypothetical protein